MNKDTREPIYQYRDMTQAKVGDIVQCIDHRKSHSFTKNKLYILRSNYIPKQKSGYMDGGLEFKQDDNNRSNGWTEKWFRLIKTKDWKDAKIGDFIVCIGPAMHTIDIRDVRTIRNICKSSETHIEIRGSSGRFTKDRWIVIDQEPDTYKNKMHKLKQY